ncbi:hypothetical protein [Gaetbulibacter jejuensis]|uniref:hypothetical protein n=1 Tax=Gaetbulibacter jejuensis TaxID=584607 RepID=UPI003009EDA5
MKKYTFLLFAGFLFTSCVVEEKYLYHERGKDYWVSIEEYYELKYQKGVELNKWNPDICPSPKDYAESWTELTLKNSKPKKTSKLTIFSKQ